MRHARSDGFRCRHCNSCLSRVCNTYIYKVTYYGQTKTLIKRRRICIHCKLPFTTIETMEDEGNPGNPEIITPPPIPPSLSPFIGSLTVADSEPNKIHPQGVPSDLLPPKKTAPKRRKKGR